MLILNIGGTLNKRYNAITGELEVPFDNGAIQSILKSSAVSYNLAGLVYKDSLDMDANDRRTIADIILHSTEKVFVLIHGTDTMDETSEFLDAIFDDRKIILVGAIKPFEIDTVESSLNIGMALGFAKAVENNGVYICMSGHIESWKNIKKNKVKGIFEIVE